MKPAFNSGTDGDAARNADVEGYVAPKLVRLGTLTDLTKGTDSNKTSDGLFPGSLLP